ncbi:MAG: crossover junction endodeoxyribonuclease RuvC [Deltaproteobacteria bacterium]|nr:MAG: crossover junction endodeoxyribonuclease RuvC [Deltaproteobacteria bacterium]
MRVLGIDPGTQVMGYGVVEEDKGKLGHIGDGIISPPGGLPERLKGIYDGLIEVIRRYSPEVVAMESPFFAKNVKSSLKLGQVQGVILLATTHSSLSSFAYAPMEVKSAIAGYGRATKVQVREMVKRLLGLDGPLSLDASDALAVAICHIHTAELKGRYQRQVLPYQVP